ncbi:MAG: STAS domain-containing protein [Streptosporangiaceae bacterium]|jgi:anti-anti-sigma factor
MVNGQSIYDDGVLQIMRADDPPRLTVRGEIDESTYPGLMGALRTVADGPAELHVDLAGVAYCDLAGLRAIVDMTSARDGGAGRYVILHNVPAQLQTVLAIVGWNATPGLCVTGRAGADGHARETQADVLYQAQPRRQDRMEA